MSLTKVKAKNPTTGRQFAWQVVEGYYTKDEGYYTKDEGYYTKDEVEGEA